MGRGDVGLALIFVTVVVGVLATAVTLVVRRQSRPVPAYEQLRIITGQFISAKPHIASKSKSLRLQISVRVDPSRSWTGNLFGWGCTEQQLTRHLGSHPMQVLQRLEDAQVTLKHWDGDIVELRTGNDLVLGYDTFVRRAECR